MNKIRLRSPLDRLPLHIKQQLAAWLTTGGQHGHGLTYTEAREKLLSEFGITASVSGLCKYFQRHARPAPKIVLLPADPKQLAQLRDDPDWIPIIIPVGTAKQPAVRVRTRRSASGDTLTIILSINLTGKSTP